MLFAVNGLIGCPVEASDGDIGSVKDFLLDDRSWKVRWMTVDTGHWLPGRQVLIHPSAIAPLELPPKPALPMMSGGQTLTISVRLTKQQIDSSPDAREGAPCTAELETRLYNHYGIDPYWGDTYFGPDAIDPLSKPIAAENAARQQAMRSGAGEGDLYLGSVAEMKGFTVHATDGDLGPVENILADDANWDIRYLVVASRHWLPGKLVQLAPYSVTNIDWRDRRVSVNVTRNQVKSAPAWDPVAMVDKVAEDQLHQHFGWPGYGR
jgi:hypothetical protein